MNNQEIALEAAEKIDSEQQTGTLGVPSLSKIILAAIEKGEQPPATDEKPRTHHNTCPKGDRCACYLTGYTDAEYDHGLALETLENDPWTAGYVRQLLGGAGWSGAWKICDAHNAALAAAYQKGLNEGRMESWPRHNQP